MLQLISDFPWWAWFLCFAVGAGFATALYVRDSKLNLSWPYLRLLLAFFRFIVVSLAAILLLDPYLRTALNEEIRPVAILLQDNSQSVAEKMEDTSAYQQEWASLQTDLKKSYDVQTYTFGQELQPDGAVDFSGQSTDMSSALTAINQIYRFVNVGAVIVAGDGIYNAGENPLYASYDINAPLYTIGLGDTTPQKDLRVVRVLANRIVFTGDQFNVHVELAATLAKGDNMSLSVYEVTDASDRSLGTKVIPVEDNRFQAENDFTLAANTPGIHHYRIKVDNISGEANTANNQYDIYVEVLDARQKILLLADGPHPDIAALRAAIEKNRNYDLTVQLARDYQGAASDYSLVILHRLPSGTQYSRKIVQDLQKTNMSLWIITGQLPSYSALQELQQLVRIQGGNSKGDEVTASGNQGFNLFEMTAEEQARFAKFPPLLAPYGEYSVAANVQTLFFQRLGTVSTRQPLLLFSQPGTRKTAVLCGENIWRWRMHDFLQHNDHETFDGLVSKTIQYLSTKEDQKQFRVRSGKTLYNDYERVQLDAELYNDALELINKPDVSCVVTDNSGKEYPYTFSRSGSRYSLDAGFLPAGNYRVEARTSYNNKVFADQTAFSVAAVQLETSLTVADHQLMNRLAADHSGTMYAPGQLSALTETLLNSDYAKPILKEKVKTRSVINLSWLLFLLAALLGLEWWIRKWSGGY